MATPPIDPTMQIPSPELVKRIESLVSSLLGVTSSRVERDDAGAIRLLHASVAPGHSPDRVRREIRSALLSSLDLELASDVVDVEVEEQIGRRQEQFWQAPEREADVASEAGSDRDRTAEDGFEDRMEQSSRIPEEEGSEDSADPESWLSRADARSPQRRELGRAAERWPDEDRRSPGDRRSEEDRRAEEDRRSDDDRRSGGDRRDERDRRDPEDRRSGIDRRAEEREKAREREALQQSGAGNEGRSASAENAEIPSADYIDAIIDRLRARERERGGVFPSTASEEGGAASTEGTPTDATPTEGTSTERTSSEASQTEATRGWQGGQQAAATAYPGAKDEIVGSGEELSGPDTDMLPLSLGEYVLMGGGGEERGVELRVRVETAGRDGFVGTVRVPSLEDVTPGIFVGATLRAVEQALDASPVSERSARILILEAVDMEEVVLREGRFVTATIQAVQRNGESRATGLVPADGRIIREAAAEAALDAVGRILQGRHAKKVEGRGRIRRDVGAIRGGGGSGDSGSGGPSGSRGGLGGVGGAGGRDAADRGETGRGAGERGGRGRATGEGDRAFTRDPFNIWE